MGVSKKLFEDLNQRFESYNVIITYEYEYNFSQKETDFPLSKQNTNNQ